MRRLVLCGMVVSAPLLAGCGAENIQGPSFASRDALLADAAAHSAPVYTYRSVAYPGATATTAWGINAGGDVVGDYVDPAGVRHGFLVRNGEFTTIDFPNALTSARGIGPGGNTVGIYRGASEPAVNAHGFLLSRQGDTTLIAFPGHTNTIPQRILPDGTILGCRHDNDTMGSMRGVAFDRSGPREIAAFASMNNGATPDRRRIVGLWTGFHGFVQTVDGDYVSIDFPGATATRAFGINARGDVVGSYVAAGQTFGFVAQRTH